MTVLHNNRNDYPTCHRACSAIKKKKSCIIPLTFFSAIQLQFQPRSQSTIFGFITPLWIWCRLHEEDVILKESPRQALIAVGWFPLRQSLLHKTSCVLIRTSVPKENVQRFWVSAPLRSEVSTINQPFFFVASPESSTVCWWSDCYRSSRPSKDEWHSGGHISSSQHGWACHLCL